MLKSFRIIVLFMPKNIIITLLVTLSCLSLMGCADTASFYSNTHPSSTPSSSIGSTQVGAGNDVSWQENSYALWNTLQRIPLRKLEARLTDPTNNATQVAWLKLAIISKRYTRDSKQLAEQLMQWHNENPTHPGNQLFKNGTLSSVLYSQQPRHIALLLPLQGPLGSSGQAIRDGILSAYYASLAKTHIQQTISFYDTSAQSNIGALYQQAIEKGADVVIGPLMKEDVQKLLDTTQISIPTLALNYTEGSLPLLFYEFGLSPVDEAQQVADKAWQAGLSRAIVIAPQTPWGQRVSKTLVSRWQSLGGQVTDSLYYAKRTDFNQSIANLLHINQKEDRQKTQEGNSKAMLEQQRRQDFDVIFLLADPTAAREIVPLLKYYYAARIPIYATSVVYSGSPNPQKDVDLNGVIFADIPWLLKSSKSTNRLYAVGRDAYVISGELERLKNLPQFPLYAATGALTLTSAHQIYRRLPWAQIHNGHP